LCDRSQLWQNDYPALMVVLREPDAFMTWNAMAVWQGKTQQRFLLCAPLEHICILLRCGKLKIPKTALDVHLNRTKLMNSF
jgi:hypothetical protein